VKWSPWGQARSTPPIQGPSPRNPTAAPQPQRLHTQHIIPPTAYTADSLLLTNSRPFAGASHLSEAEKHTATTRPCIRELCGAPTSRPRLTPYLREPAPLPIHQPYQSTYAPVISHHGSNMADLVGCLLSETAHVRTCCIHAREALERTQHVETWRAPRRKEERYRTTTG
jgi:hypothetical protein